MTPQSSGATQTRGAMSELHSRLFPSLFDGLGDDTKPVILDVGPASPATVAFFSRLRCRLYFADLFEETAVVAAQEDVAPEQLKQRFEELMAYPEGTQFDIVLFWDILNYLDRPVLQPFIDTLRAYTHRGTRAHAFVTSKSSIAAAPRVYRIREADAFVVHERHGEQRPCAAHPTAELQKLMRGFEIERGVLLRDGMQELLFRRV